MRERLALAFRREKARSVKRDGVFDAAGGGLLYYLRETMVSAASAGSRLKNEKTFSLPSRHLFFVRSPGQHCQFTVFVLETES